MENFSGARKLTVAIPTCNRAAQLKERINELLPQLTEQVELRIFDNASEDDTREMVAAFRSDRICYTRNARNYHAINFLKCIESAGGEWLWMLADDDPIEADAIQTIFRTIEHSASSWILFYNACFQGAPPIDTTVRDVAGLLPVVSLSALTFISGFIARTDVLQANLWLYAIALSTASPQVVVCLRGLESEALAVQICSKPLLKLVPPAVEWSPFAYIRGACTVPQFLNRAENRKRVAETVFQQVFSWGFAAHLEKIETRDDFLLWKAVYRQSYTNLAVYAPGLFWKRFRVQPPLARAVRRLISACLVALIARAPFWSFRPLLHVHRSFEKVARRIGKGRESAGR